MTIEEAKRTVDSVPDWYYSSSRQEMLSFVPAMARQILDVGCGEGKFGALLKEKLGAEVWGIEYEPGPASAAGERLDRVFTGDALAIAETLEPANFDCITILDVLEHLKDPFALLERVKVLLCPEGVLVLSVPNVLYISNLYRLLLKKEWHYIDHGVLDIGHLRFFTRNSLRNALQSCGYHIDQLHGIFPVGGNGGRLFSIFNIITLGHFSESRYLQFACVARPI
jgi:2-polyprenyl-3-methyl-5-hydroxy-6-metoxy-1,4-benzoquinol methylase